MLFNSYEFLLFFPLVAFIYFLLPDRIRYLFLLAVSYFYYMCWKAEYALLMLLSTLITYISGLLLDASFLNKWLPRSRRLFRKFIVFLSFLSNLGILFFFKYYGFFTEIITDLCGRFHITFRAPVLQLILPVGISFYTFQALSYTMDVYRGEIYAEKNFFRYALFVSFFPQLVAGPIERSKNLLEQLSRKVRFDYERMVEGLLYMIWGFFMKLVVADRIAVFVDTIYGNPMKYTGWYLIVATFLFNYQAYCDVAGYSTIAIGAARILGIDLMENFNAPYLSRSIKEFWTRWHISLTSWFRDYLYFPLGGSRKGKLRKYVNIMIILLASGLWHGANMTYVCWGLLYGLYQVLGEVLKPVRDFVVKILHLNRESAGHRLLQIGITYSLVTSCVPLFRAQSLSDAVFIYKSMFLPDNPWVLFNGSLYDCGLDHNNFVLLIICIAIIIFFDCCKYNKISIHKEIAKQDFWLRGLVIGLAVFAILLFGVWGPEIDNTAFIYYQF